MKKRPTKARNDPALSAPATGSKQDASHRLAAELGRIVGKFLADEALARGKNRKPNLSKQE